MDILDNLELYLDNLDTKIDNVQTILDSIFTKSFQEQLSKLDNMDKAKFNIIMAYVINTLFFVYLKTNGIPTKDHPVMKELERVKKYFLKIKKLETHEKAKFKLDKEAAGRMIKNSLSSDDQKINNSVERLLKSVTEEVERRKKNMEDTTSEEKEEPNKKRNTKDNNSSKSNKRQKN